MKSRDRRALDFIKISLSFSSSPDFSTKNVTICDKYVSIWCHGGDHSKWSNLLFDSCGLLVSLKFDGDWAPLIQLEATTAESNQLGALACFGHAGVLWRGIGTWRDLRPASSGTLEFNLVKSVGNGLIAHSTKTIRFWVMIHIIFCSSSDEIRIRMQSKDNAAGNCW